MRVKFGLAGLLAALALAGLPGVASAGWSTALTVGLRPPPEAPEAEAPKAGKANGDEVFQLTCRRCRRGCSNYSSGYAAYSSGYGAYSSGYSSYYFYPSYSSYAG